MPALSCESGGWEPRAASDTAAAAERGRTAWRSIHGRRHRLGGWPANSTNLEQPAQRHPGRIPQHHALHRAGEGKERPEPAGCRTANYITALWFQLRSVPAALYKALGAFATNNVNLTKLESYIGTQHFDRARFYVEIEGHESDSPVLSALEEIEYYTDIVRVLGSFPQHEFRRQRNKP